MIARNAGVSPDPEVGARPAILIAMAMTGLAEIIYLVAFGIVIFPEGDLVTKIVWATTCAVAIAAVVAAAVLILEPRRGPAGALVAFSAMAVVGTYCTLLCAWLDARLGMFGGAEQSALFILSGVIPAALGGVIYAWALNADAAAALRRMFGGGS